MALALALPLALALMLALWLCFWHFVSGPGFWSLALWLWIPTLALSLLLYIFTKLSVDLYSGALFIQESLGWNLYVSVILLIGMTALLTVTGGLVAVIYTDTLQALLMIIGALTLMVISMVKIGGFEEVKRRYMLASPDVASILLKYNLSNTNACMVHPKANALKMLRDPTDEDVPWPGFILGHSTELLEQGRH